MSELERVIDAQREIAEFVPPGERGQKIAALDAASRHAAKIGDLEALRIATLEKLAEQAAAALDYGALFQHGGDRSKSADSADLLSRTEWLRQLGVSDDTVRRWRDKLLDDAAREAKADAIVERTAKLIRGEQAANFSSETNEWYTPARYIEAVRDLYGGAIDLDPATSVAANQTVQAAEIYTIGDNALEQEWRGRAFMNPPYGVVKGESVAGMFCRKAIEEYDAGRLEACVILVNSVHSQRWQAPLYAFPVCFVDHRISFVNGEGQSNENPTFSNIFVYLGEDISSFARRFDEFGYVMRRVLPS